MTQTNTKAQQIIHSINELGCSFDINEIDDYTDDVLIAFAVKDISFIDKLPKNRMTDPVLFAVAENERFWDIMRFVNDEDTTQYRDLAIRAVATNSRNLQFISDQYVDVTFLEAVLAADGYYSISAFHTFHPDVANQHFGQDGLQTLMESDATIRDRLLHEFLNGNLNNANITDEFIKDSLVMCPGLAQPLKRASREHLLVEVVKEGGWPAAYANDKPSDLDDAIRRMRKPMSSIALAWQRAYVKTFDMTEVVKALKAPSKIEMLETIYTRAEIRPHLTQRRDAKIKGQWLEDDLGM